MRAILAIAVALACIVVSPAAAKTHRDLTSSEAILLVSAYVGPQPAKLSWDIGNARHGFYSITGIDPAPGAEGFDLYEVDAHTGDVWRASICEQLSNGRFHTVQRKLWREIGLTTAEYRRLKRPGGECRYE